MASESERSPAPDGAASQPRIAQAEESASAASRRTASEGDILDVPRSTSVKSQAQAAVTSQFPKLSSALPGISAPASTTNSTISSRETSPVRSSRRVGNSSTSTPRVSSRPRKSSQDRSPPRSTAPSVSATAVQRALSQVSKPPLLPPPTTTTDSSSNAPSPEKTNMPIWASNRRPDQESTPPNTSSKRSAHPSSDETNKDAHAWDRSSTVRRSIPGPAISLETVQEMASDPSTTSADTILNVPVAEESRFKKMDEDPSKRGAKQNVESGSESSGGNKSSEQKDDTRRPPASAASKITGDILPKRSFTSLSGARNKPADGSVRNMIVETETVSSIPQVSLGVATGDRNGTGRVDSGTLRMKPSTETIRPRKEKKKTRKPTALSTGTASSKADIFEAKVASAVDEADVSDSDETFVYESNPPDPYPARQHRYHSRTPSATSMASQVDQLAGRVRPGLREGNHSVTGKRSMKFTNNTYNSSVDGEAGENEGGRSNLRAEGSGSHTPRHHHIGRYGRNGMYPSLFDNDSPFPPPHTHPKSPRHFVGNGYRQTRHTGSRTLPNYRTVHNGSSKKADDVYGYDYDAEGADDERTPLVGSTRAPRSRHGRRPGSASLRQMEYMQQRQRGFFSQYGACAILCFLLFLLVGGSISFIFAVTKPLLDVEIIAIQNVLASEQEIMLDLSVQAVNPNIFPVAIDDMDMNIFAKSRFVGTDQLWRDHGKELHEFPHIERSRQRAPLSQAVTCRQGGDCLAASTRSLHVAKGVDKGTDPIPTDPAGDPQTMLLGRVFHFDSPLAFDPSPWNHATTSSKGQIRLARPGNKTEEGGTERWERVLQHPFDLIVRGVVKYQLPLTSRVYSASVSSSVKVIPEDDDNTGSGDGQAPKNDTVGISPAAASANSPLKLPDARLQTTVVGRAFTA